MNLLKTEIDENYIIKNIDISGIEEKRLYSLGITLGVIIKKIYVCELSEKSIYQIKNSAFVIDKDTAKYIEVESIYE